MQLFDLTDKNVLITGGTRGIGFAIAQGVKQAGGRVWIHGSSEDRTEGLQRKMNLTIFMAISETRKG